ncbi:MAG TPA: hypothetical protein DCE41_02895 [Cytophagales bacterium]|nr:hypothetical protein [Cytophagales bacterium]
MLGELDGLGGAVRGVVQGGTLKGTLGIGLLTKSLTIFKRSSLRDRMGTRAKSKQAWVDLIDSIEDEQLVLLLTRIAAEKTESNSIGNRIKQLPDSMKEELDRSYQESFDRQQLISRQNFENHLGSWDEQSS